MTTPIGPAGPGERPDLTRLLHEVGTVPAPAADYGSVVRAGVARGRLTRAGVIAAVVLAGVAAAVSFAVVRGDDGTVTATPPVTTAPTVAPTPEPTTAQPTQAPSPTPTATPAPIAVPTTPAPVIQPPPSPPPVTREPEPAPTTAPPATRSPSPRPRVTTASPRPQPYAPRDLSVSLSGPSTAFAGDPTTMQVRVRDSDGLVVSARVEWGDGRSSTFSMGPTCRSSSGTAPEPTSSTKAVQHTYTSTGSFTAVVTVTTGSTCRSTPRETRSASTRIEIS